MVETAMRSIHLVVLVTLAAGASMVARAAEKPPADYQQAMKDLGGVMQALTKPGAAEDFEQVRKSAESAKAAYEVVKQFWRNKRAADALELAENGGKAAADLYVVANLSSVEGVEVALKDMGATCQACHAAHREKTAEGFEIK